MPPEPTPSNDDIIVDRLNRIALHLERMDKRDKLRTTGAFIRSIIALVPMIIFVWSTWYIIEHGDELIAKFTEQAAKQTMKYTQEQSQGMLEQLQQMVPRR